jgi:hypothetical protein
MPLKRQKKVNGLDVRFGAVSTDCVTLVSHFGAVHMGATDPAHLELVLLLCYGHRYPALRPNSSVPFRLRSINDSRKTKRVPWMLGIRQ